MDFGLDRLIELIEERFGALGKPITTAMLIMVVLAVFVMAADMVWKKAVLPLSRLLSGIGWQATKKEILLDLLSLGIFILLAYVGLRVADHFMAKKADKIFEETKALYDETVFIHNRTKQEILAVEEKIATVEEELEPVRKDLDEILRATGLSGPDKEDSQSQ